MRFRSLVVEYFNDIQSGAGRAYRAIEVRSEINKLMELVRGIVLSSGVNTKFTSAPSPSIGGYWEGIDIISDLFNLDGIGVSLINVIDVLDKSIGVYEADSKLSIRRAVNPFFYLGWLLSVLMRAPFFIWGEAGFDRERAERSVWGRLVKVGIGFISVLASWLTVFDHLGYWESIKRFLGI